MRDRVDVLVSESALIVDDDDDFTRIGVRSSWGEREDDGPVNAEGI